MTNVSSKQHNLAIETSARVGSVCLGVGDQLLESIDLPQQRRHAIDLMPAIDRLCQNARITPNDLGQIYISVGPGSFTGLRVGITTAKTLSFATGCEIFAIGSMDVVAENAPADLGRTLAVCLNAKRGECYSGIYHPHGSHWQATAEPILRTPAQLIEEAGLPLTVIGDHLPEFDWPDQVQILPDELATPLSEKLWQLGRARATEHAPERAMDLVPCYVRLPEAEEIWQQKQGNG